MSYDLQNPVSVRVEHILNYLTISDTIGTAGQPTPQQFAGIKAAGYEVVVNLAMPDSSNALPDERDLVAEQGMGYVHIPVVWEHPTSQDLERFLDILTRCRRKRVFVHCALNMRVAVFILLYRVICQGIALEVAREDLLRIWQPNTVWQRFMDDSLAEYGIRA
jgi:protein tyrosine phosphatase (PTP) superfamily phosphohydrolase (DUF442 family)